jgi:type II secretory pathway component PulK
MIMKKRKGVALLIVLVLSAVIFSTVGLIAVLSENSYKSQSSKLLDYKAFDVAESGANL